MKIPALVMMHQAALQSSHPRFFMWICKISNKTN